MGNNWEPYAHGQAALQAIETQLAQVGGDVELMLARADLLAGLGRFDAAKAAYLAVLALRPDHLTALNNFGALAHGRGYTTAARTLYAEAARRHPASPMANVNLANSLMEIGETEAARAAYEAALSAAPGYGPAHQGLARLASMRGEAQATTAHLRAAFGREAVIEQPYSGAAAPIEVLLLISGVMGDLSLQHILDPAVFRVTALAPQFFDPARPLPAHQLMLNGIGDADLCADALRAAAALVLRTGRPIINPPERVLETGRVANARRLGAIPGVVTAASASLPKSALRGANGAAVAALGLRFPIAIRSPGFHTGEHFERIDHIDRLAPALETLPGDEVILMDLLDTRGRDGKFRKYRVMAVDGRLFPAHMAVSGHWKVHYFSADMAQAPAHRAEDAAFLAGMAETIGARAMGALERVREALALDYGGMDFALSPQGEVVLFEANATMAIHPPPEDPMWDYRRAPIAALLAAVKTMIARRATGPGSPPGAAQRQICG